MSLTRRLGSIFFLLVLVGCAKSSDSGTKKYIPLIKSAQGKIYSPACLKAKGLDDMAECEVSASRSSNRGLWQDWYSYGYNTSYYYYNLWLYPQNTFCNYFGWGNNCYQNFGYYYPTYTPSYSCWNCFYNWSSFCTNYCYLNGGYPQTTSQVQSAYISGYSVGESKICFTMEGKVQWTQGTTANGTFEGTVTAVTNYNSYDVAIQYAAGNSSSKSLSNAWKTGVGLYSRVYYAMPTSTGALMVTSDGGGSQACFQIKNATGTQLYWSGYVWSAVNY